MNPAPTASASANPTSRQPDSRGRAAGHLGAQTGLDRRGASSGGWVEWRCAGKRDGGRRGRPRREQRGRALLWVAEGQGDASTGAPDAPPPVQPSRAARRSPRKVQSGGAARTGELSRALLEPARPSRRTQPKQPARRGAEGEGKGGEPRPHSALQEQRSAEKRRERGFLPPLLLLLLSPLIAFSFSPSLSLSRFLPRCCNPQTGSRPVPCPDLARAPSDKARKAHRTTRHCTELPAGGSQPKPNAQDGITTHEEEPGPALSRKSDTRSKCGRGNFAITPRLHSPPSGQRGGEDIVHPDRKRKLNSNKNPR